MRADPIGIDKGFNLLYVYAKNNPIVNSDPTGLKCEVALKIPTGYKSESKTDWEDWEKWVYSFTYTEGGQYPIFWLNATCICKRHRTGTEVVKKEVEWFYVELCFDGCDLWSNEYSRWEELSKNQKTVSETDQISLVGGYYMNESSAEWGCKRKCEELN